MRKAILISFAVIAVLTTSISIKRQQQVLAAAEPEWISLFDGKNLDGWSAHGKTTWEVKEGVLVGRGGMGHIYADPVLTDLEVKGMFRISKGGNSGLYFRCNPPKDNPDGFPRGYEAQIDNHTDAFTGWLWKPGTPTGKAKELLTKDNEWFSMHVKAVGDHIQIWVNGKLVTDHHDSEFRKGHFAIQGHNEEQTVEAKELYYRDLGKNER